VRLEQCRITLPLMTASSRLLGHPTVLTKRDLLLGGTHIAQFKLVMEPGANIQGDPIMPRSLILSSGMLHCAQRKFAMEPGDSEQLLFSCLMCDSLCPQLTSYELLILRHNAVKFSCGYLSEHCTMSESTFFRLI
jgi:hypothetical protein